MTINPTAICPCGFTVTVTAPERGRSLYGTLADRMQSHEFECTTITRNSQWTFDHSPQCIGEQGVDR